MSDLSLTGKSISPKQQMTRTYSARSSRSSSSDMRRLNSDDRSKNTSYSRITRPKPEMALAFPKDRNIPTRRTDVTAPKTTSSSEYLTFFDAPQNRAKSANVRRQGSYSDVGATSSNIRPERDRNRPSKGFDNKRGNDTSTKTSEHAISPRSNVNRSSKKSSEDRPKEVSKRVDDKGVLEKREESAVTIQKWYRRHSQRTKSSEAALKRMLQQKKAEVESTMQEEKLRTTSRSEDEKRKQRREREREQRKKAIEELRKSREDQERKYRSIVDEEMAAIAGRKKNKAKRRDYSKTPTTPPPSDSQVIKTVEDKIDSIFEETKLPPSVQQQKSSEDDESIPEELEEDPEENAGKAQGLLESLLETIQQLEAEPEQLKKIESNSRLEEKLAWIDEMQSDHFSSVSNTRTQVTEEGGGDFVDGKYKPQSVTTSHADNLLTKAKLSNLMDFLEDVDKKDQVYEATKGSEVSMKAKESHVSVKRESSPPESSKVAELVEAEKTASEVTTELLKLRLNVDEKTKSVELLKKALSQQRELAIRQAHDQEKEMNLALKRQKEQYESTIQRHLSFIDQLIDDKKVLHEKCERVVLEMKQAESKYQKKIKELQEAHAVEVKKQKEILGATEKLRREKWMEHQTRTIKETTVKALEPEIQRLIAKHKQEVKKLKAIHEAELLQSDERAGQRYIRQTEELREHLEREKEAACNREREMARQRYEKQLEQEEMALQQQRRRLYAEVADEKERLNEQAARQRADIDRLKEQLEKQNNLATSALTEEYKKSKGEAERRHTAEIETLKERMELEKQAWQGTYMKKQEAFVLQKERELKDAVRHDRDAEIETVIEQLEKDMRVQRDQIEKTAENRIKRIREKYESELKEIESLERQTQEKYNNMKVQYSDIEAENMKLKSTVTQKDQEILDVKKVKDKLVEERGNVTDIVREEFAERLVHTDEENKRMKNELAQMRARHRLELDRVNQEKEDELSEVHKRVKAAIVKKEEAIAQIKQQHESAVKRADHLEGLLETQRKQLMGKKK